MVALSTYLNQPSNQILTVTETTLTGSAGNFNTAPNTAGTNSGYLILNAVNGCIIDAVNQVCQIQSASKRLLFINFIPHGRIDVSGQDIIFWYPAFSFPGVDRSKIPGPNAFISSLYHSPDGWALAGSQRFQCYGFNGKDCADLFDTSGAISYHLEGGFTHDQYPSNGSIWHSDTLDGVAGSKTTSGNAVHCTFMATHLGQHFATFEPSAGHSYTFSIGDSWITGFDGAAFDPGTNGVTHDGGPVTITSTDNGVYLFGNTANLNPGATYQGTFHQSTPAGSIGVDDPATQWKQANPLGSWTTFFPFAGGGGTKPTAPRNVVAVAGAGQATINWVAPLDPGSSAIDQYRVTPNPLDVPATTTTALTKTVSGLTNGQPYTFKVEAHNTVGYGPGATSNQVTPQASSTVPDAPNILGVSPGNGNVGIFWSVPFDGGAPIDFYEALTTPGSTPVPFAAPASGGTVTGLVNGTSYTVKVRAHNTNGYSLYSADSAPFAPTPGGITVQGFLVGAVPFA